MLHSILSLLALTAPAPGLSPCAVPFDATDAELLFEVLEARDAALFPLRLAYRTADLHGRPVAGEIPHLDPKDVEQSGWIWWSGDELLAEFDRFEAGAATIHTSVVHTPGRNDALVRDLRPESDERWPGVRITEKAVGAFLDATVPIHFGLGYMYAPWSKVRDLSGPPRIVGRETLLGRDCLHLALDYGAALGTGKTVSLELWVDDRESLLVLKACVLLPLHEAQRSGFYGEGEAARLAVERDGVSLVPSSIWEVRDLAQVDGHWLPTVGCLYSVGELLPHSARWTFVDLERSELLASRPDVDLSVPAGGAHFDFVRERTTLTGPGGAPLDEVQASYWTILEKLGQVGVRDHAELVESLPLGETSCGINCSLLLAHLNDRWCSIEELLQDSGLQPADETSLLDLAQVLERQGLAARSVELTLDALRAWDGDVVVHTVGSRPRTGLEDELVDHFMVVRMSGLSGDSPVRYVNAPVGVSAMTLDQFREIWTGEALLVDADPARVDGFLADHHGRRSALPWALSLGLLGLATTLLVGRRHVRVEVIS